MTAIPAPMTDPITTDEDVLRHVTALVGQAYRRQLWLMFLDADDHALPVLMPIEAYPQRPTHPQLERIASVISLMIDELQAASVMLTWERPGPGDSTSDERLWAAALGIVCEVREVSVRAQLLASREGVRLFEKAEYFAVAA
ncbi:hypothetical protein HDC34_002211 [Pseudoclavibacter sp. JAI123]|uniref:hypothetical protein n=1 Tax=Pseudoclavibacter sp. JAI123 TaxID=2723065 RepID=UPI0015C7BD0D|nr:hypothetical protein [Pseudoclavibacter sp. JAI123]NYF13917.1 hypothetical protein [Pseudoclavibacter sp. JAI123]